MKLLNTEQQVELQDIFARLQSDVAYDNLDLLMKNDINFWAIELKAKRVRTKKVAKTSQELLDIPANF